MRPLSTMTALSLALLLACGGTPEGSRPTTVAPATEPAPEPTPVAIAEPGAWSRRCASSSE